MYLKIFIRIKTLQSENSEAQGVKLADASWRHRSVSAPLALSTFEDRTA